MVQPFGYIGPRGILITVFTIPGNTYKPMQYTGLKDKKGKEIYEGDVVAVREYKWVVEMGYSTDGEYGWLQKRVGMDGGKSYIITENDGIDERYEVIGNSYENPELLKNV